jgi:hypothetical protein
VLKTVTVYHPFFTKASETHPSFAVRIMADVKRIFMLISLPCAILLLLFGNSRQLGFSGHLNCLPCGGIVGKDLASLLPVK